MCTFNCNQLQKRISKKGLKDYKWDCFHHSCHGCWSLWSLTISFRRDLALVCFVWIYCLKTVQKFGNLSLNILIKYTLSPIKQECLWTTIKQLKSIMLLSLVGRINIFLICSDEPSTQSDNYYNANFCIFFSDLTVRGEVRICAPRPS